MSNEWQAAVSRALEDPAMRLAYWADTGAEFVDSAKYVIGFSRWFTETHWGIENAPEGVRRSLFGGNNSGNTLNSSSESEP